MNNLTFRLPLSKFWGETVLTVTLLSSSFLAPLVPLATPPAQAQNSYIASEVQALRQSNQRWIQVDLSTQRLIAWEGNQPVHAVIVSTGKFSSPTLTGVFAVQSKQEVGRMTGQGYDVDEIPFILYYSGNYAIHGTYWHNQFGTPVSHGCVNVAVDHAEWLFDWASVGTPVIVQI